MADSKATREIHSCILNTIRPDREFDAFDLSKVVDKDVRGIGFCLGKLAQKGLIKCVSKPGKRGIKIYRHFGKQWPASIIKPDEKLKPLPSSRIFSTKPHERYKGDPEFERLLNGQRFNGRYTRASE